MNDPRPTVLIVAYAFPPNAAVGSMRPLRWCRWLPRVSAWQPAVLTVDTVPVRHDPSLLASLPEQTKVIRTPIAEPWYGLSPPGRPQGLLRRSVLKVCGGPLESLLATPDPQVFWRRSLVPAGLEAARALGARAVIATAPPWSALDGAARLADAAGLPLVLDFRDPWTEIDRGGMSPRRLARERHAERDVCSRAAAVISTSETYSANLAARCPDQPRGKFVTLHNGFDEEAFAEAPAPPVPADGLTVVHLGSLYARRRPFAMLAGARRWLDARPERSADFRLVFVGTPDRVTRQAVAEHGLEDVVHITGHLPHAEAIARCRAADLLLLAMGDSELTPAGWLPSKLFEYIALQRPVLAHTVDGEAARLLREAGAARLVAGDDPAAFAAALEEYWQAKLAAGGAPAHTNDPQVVAALHQENLARRLAGLLDQVSGRSA